MRLQPGATASLWVGIPFASSDPLSSTWHTHASPTVVVQDYELTDVKEKTDAAILQDNTVVVDGRCPIFPCLPFSFELVMYSRQPDT